MMKELSKNQHHHVRDGLITCVMEQAFSKYSLHEIHISGNLPSDHQRDSFAKESLRFDHVRDDPSRA